MSEKFIFTSESVSEGHPDKMADQISDGILDAILTQDPKARVACGTMITTGLIVTGKQMIFGLYSGGFSNWLSS